QLVHRCCHAFVACGRRRGNGVFRSFGPVARLRAAAVRLRCRSASGTPTTPAAVKGREGTTAGRGREPELAEARSPVPGRLAKPLASAGAVVSPSVGPDPRGGHG